MVGPLPSGSGVTGMNRFVESRQAAEHVIAVRREPVVQSHAELVLVHGLVGDATVVVRRARARGQRIPLEKVARDRVHPSCRNRVVRELAPGHASACRWRRGRRVVDDRHASGDGFREDALPLERGRHRGDHRPADGLPLPLVVEEEERAVAPDRTADHSAELVAAKLRLHGARRREEVSRVHRFVPGELEDASAQRIATRLGRQVDHAAVEPAELGRRAVAFDLELLDRVDVGKERHLPWFGLQHGDAVEQVLVGARPAAVDARKRRSRAAEAPPRQAPGLTSLRKLRPLSGRSTIRRLSMTCPRLDVSLRRERRVGPDRHGLVDRAHLQLCVHPNGFTRRKAECPRASTAGIRSAPRAAVHAGRQPRHHVAAIAGP